METKELPFVRDMFDRIAPRYDLLNRLLSLRQDVRWRKKMVSKMTVPDRGRILDVACGTGDVLMEIRRQKGPKVHVIGLDFSAKMLDLAREKTRPESSGTISLVAGDALTLPFESESVHAITIAFGIRNIQNKALALKTFANCLAPGGMLLVLELATPKKGPLRDAYLAYFQTVLPLIGRFFSRHHYAYSYLPDSVSRFPAPEQFMNLMQAAGFNHIRCMRLTLGVANLFVGIKA
ncbi:bifunctional demethylmenaquinone methyltransferase/2-methoxy-6-polyprenyl-1,4-benzoquinol methylase UbiE [Desulfosarcina variabilis]|uniref:bifunctional demethylmenaquinone methyltransferase/2-methoxy-6-polyprenyl-1,4-benzoquinol methylase UbiE n=1 Tax=Desulfosarcina variabilis TaxID=2300 RepID=UPI003AFB4A23